MNGKIKQLKVKVKDVKKVKGDVFLISFSCGHIARRAKPGNFIHIKIDSVILRRPFSIHKVETSTVFILFKVKGRGTRALAAYKKGKVLDIIGPLGEGFKISPQSTVHSPQNILAAGGIGVAPLLFLGGKLRGMRHTSRDAQNVVLLGDKTKDEILCEKDFNALGFKVEIATDDGSKGHKGNVTDLLKNILRTTNDERRTTIYACGPELMFKAIHKIIKKYPNVDCQVSFEQFMGCGIGTCCACTINTKNGYKKVCKDGPVFDIDEVW